jgi:hypothetical protein
MTPPLIIVSLTIFFISIFKRKNQLGWILGVFLNLFFMFTFYYLFDYDEPYNDPSDPYYSTYYHDLKIMQTILIMTPLLSIFFSIVCLIYSKIWYYYGVFLNFLPVIFTVYCIYSYTYVPYVFLGDKGARKANFDKYIKVTENNIDALYCHYDVLKILEYHDTTYYVIDPKKMYPNARWFSRLIQMVDGSQTAAITFNDYSIHFIDKMEDNLLIGLGSLRVSSPPNTPSNFDCRAIILDKYLNKSFEKVFDYQQFQHDYTFIDMMYLTKNGFYMELKNINVDNIGDSCYYYTATFDKAGMIESTKKKIGFDGKNIPDYSKSIYRIK